jgi:hypothetical protein
MKAAAVLMVFSACCALTHAQGDDKIKCNFEYLEKSLGMQYKSVRAEDSSQAQKVKITLEFTKDIDDLDRLQNAFYPLTADLTKAPIIIYFFDNENVAIVNAPPTLIEGVLSGKKGDAIRLVVSVPPDTFKKTTKLEARPNVPEKKTKDDNSTKKGR